MHSIARRLLASCLTAVLVSTVLLAAAPAGAQAWKGKGRLQGKVVDPEDQPYAGAKVTLRLVENPELGPEPLTSDAKGRWSVLGLAGGQWTIRVETAEYLPAEATWRVSEAGAPGPPIQIELQAPSPEQMQDAAIERGNELFQAGDYAGARAAYEQALETLADSDRPAVLRGIAQTYRFEEHNDRAIETLEQALALAPDGVATLKLLVDVLLAEGRSAEAEPYLARIPAEEKLDVASRLNLGIELYNGGDLDGALEHFDQAIADFPQLPDGYYYRGLCLLGKEQNADAVAALEKFLEIAPDSPRAAEARQFVDYLKSQ